MKTFSDNTSSTKCLHDYLEVAYQSCKIFQERIRKIGDRSFNVWLFLEQQFRKHHIANNLHRKPPKAVTIEQWFNGNHLSGSKMGTEDLKLICRFINNPDPMIAYYEGALKEFFPQSNEIITDTANLNSLIIKLGVLQGNLFNEYDRAIPDGVIDAEEALRIKAAGNEIIKQCNSIISNLSMGE